jgi:C1q domain
MSKVKIQGNASGTGIFTVAAPATNTDRTLTLPDVDATVLTTAGGTTTGQLLMTGNGIDGLVKIQTSNSVQKSVFWVRDTNLGCEYTIDVAPSGRIEQWHYDGTTWRSAVQMKSGIVTTPYTPAFHAYRSSNPGVQTTLTGPLVFDGTRFNNGNYYNTSTGYFTAPVNGNYCFSVSSNMSGEQNPRQFAFYRNGAIYVRIYGDLTGSWLPTSMTHTIQLNANDTVGVWYTGRPDYGADWCNFSGHLIG